MNDNNQEYEIFVAAAAVDTFTNEFKKINYIMNMDHRIIEAKYNAIHSITIDCLIEQESRICSNSIKIAAIDIITEIINIEV